MEFYGGAEMKKTIFFIMTNLLFFTSVNATQHFSEKCEKTFQNLVYEKLIEENKLNAFHQVWWWVPGKILHGETEFSSTKWAETSGIRNDGSVNIESLSMACSELKSYSLELIKTFECPKRTI